MARKFFYVCAGMLMLALAYHFGYSTASAQAPGNPVVAAPTSQHVFTANGDMYIDFNANRQFVLVGNVFSGPTPIQRESWGQLKSRYAPKGGSTSQPGTTDR